MYKIRKIILTTCLVFLGFSPVVSRAATLTFSSLNGSYSVGETFSVSVYADSSGQSLNAASGVVSFPRELLDVTSLSKVDSIFSLWVQEPLYSNSAGTVSFEGVVLNPGFIGTNGEIITITFKVKALGTANLKFSYGSILANDGTGANILNSLGSASYSLNQGSSQINKGSITPVANIHLPSVPVISSPTHPDQSKVYSLTDAKFIWSVPNDVESVRLLYGQIPNSIPTVTYTPVVKEKELDNLDDGVWYFHVQFKNQAGWGPVGHYKFQVGAEYPQISTTTLPVPLNEPSPLFDVISEPIESRITPGEILPVSVKLANFGGSKRVDVYVDYSIISGLGDEIYSIHETVAVETTANFIKNIQIPFSTKTGVYIVKTTVVYPGQIFPATSQFHFTVEKKILGLFQGEFFLYSGITITFGVLMVFVGRLLIKRFRKVRGELYDYSHITHGQRTFYEIISDTIMQMRDRVGEDALFIAASIPGLEIDQKTGQVLTLTAPPAKIISSLVSEYEKLLGKKVSFELRRNKE